MSGGRARWCRRGGPDIRGTVTEEARALGRPSYVPVSRVCTSRPAGLREPRVFSALLSIARRNDHCAPIPPGRRNGFRTRWEAIQTGFVDEPRSAVEQADSLVSEMMKRLAEVFGDERKSLEGQWGRGDSVSTEDLRIALKRYRAFFDRLLSV